MATVANKRSVMTLYTGSDDVYSHQVRIVLAEKGVNFEAIEVVGNAAATRRFNRLKSIQHGANAS